MNDRKKREIFGKLRFSLQSLFLFLLAIGITLGLCAPAFRWKHRDVAEIEQIILQGMALVDAIESYERAHGCFPYSLPGSGEIQSPSTCRGCFAYQTWDGNSEYALYVYLGPTDGHLRWNHRSRRWVTEGRVPWSLTWTEAEIRQMLSSNR